MPRAATTGRKAGREAAASIRADEERRAAILMAIAICDDEILEDTRRECGSGKASKGSRLADEVNARLRLNQPEPGSQAEGGACERSSSGRRRWQMPFTIL